jgi:MFS transporter, putative signal transducer
MASMAKQLPAKRVLPLIAGIYIAQSVIGAVTFMGMPAVMRASGAPLDLISLISLFMVPWAIKFLWAPAIEHRRLAADGRRHSLAIIRTGQGLMAVVLALIAFATPDDSIVVILAGLALIALIAASVDIACDGFTVEQLAGRLRGWGNVMQVGGGYLGIMIGGGLFLALVDWTGWQVASLAMAGIVVLLSVPSLVSREPDGDAAVQALHRPSLSYALAQPAMRNGLLLVVLFQAGCRMSQSMAGPFLIDRQVDLGTLGIVTGAGGTSLSLLAVVLMGFMVRRFGAETLLRPVLAVQALCFALFSVAAATGEVADVVLIALFLAKTAAIAGSFVVLYTAAMQWSSLRQAGVDFTLFQCADAAIAAVAGFGGGMAAEHAGYAACFGTAAALAIAAILLLPTLLRRIAGEAARVVA